MNLETVDNLFVGAVRHHRAGRIAEAEPLYRHVLKVQPDHADATHLLGVIELQNGRTATAIALIQRAITLKPAAEYFGNYGRALAAAGQLDKAIEAYRMSLSLNPKLPQVHSNLGIALFDLGRKTEALESLKKAVELKPDLAMAHHYLGMIYLERNALGDAVHAFGKARTLRPDVPEAHNNLGIALFDAGMIDKAIICYDYALQLRPEYAEAHSNKLYALNFLPGETPANILAESQNWDRIHAEPLRGKIRPHEIDADPNRKLRVGFISADFRRHVVGWNLLTLLEQFDPQQIEVFCYSNVAKPDGVTAILQSHCSGWRDISVTDDDAAAEIIRQDRIDILVDLSLHMARNRLLVMARKPAPVQATYLGYCGTTGLETIDWRFSDPQIDPPDSDALSASIYSEKTIRLPKSYWCYRPWDESLTVSSLPADANKFITFGCLNNFSKMAMAAPEPWIRILKQVPNSRLIFHSLPGAHVNIFVAKFVNAGIAVDRLTIAGRLPLQKYLEIYNRIDITLDSFPHAGGITTCDAAWMGVPTITLRGETAVGRGGCSIMHNLDMPELIANDVDQYIQNAVNWAGDLNRLRQLRMGMRDRMAKSPLMDSKQFAHDVELVFRQMWRNWCENHKT